MAAAPNTQTQQDQADPAGTAKNISHRIEMILDRLQREFDRRYSDRTQLEQRWLKDLRQYHGKYEDDVQSDLNAGKRSTVFANATRSKTNTGQARLADMLFPTDDRNWGIQPTPVPELTDQAEKAAQKAIDLKEQAKETPEGPDQDEAMEIADQAEAAAGELQAQLDEAKDRAKAMELEIDDQLKACNYEAQCRDSMSDLWRLGTAIMKGPILDARQKNHWARKPIVATDGGVETNDWVLQGKDDKRPAYRRVDPWHFFPDMDALSMPDCDSFFERRMMTKSALRKLAKQPAFDKDAIRALLMENPRESTPSYVAELRSITGTQHDTSTDRYQILEYLGPLEPEELEALALITDQADLLDEDGRIDPLLEIYATIWFSQGNLLKFGIHPLDSNESLYSVTVLEKDDASIFGFGLPYIIRDSQAALNGGWRMMMDNGGLSSGPQIVVNPTVVEPEDGNWTLLPRKVWIRKQGPQVPGVPAFETYEISSHQNELANIITMSREMIDDESNIPVFASGEQGTHTTKTMGGMNLLMNALNIVFRRIVKNWDDDMTVPNIRRAFDWNMQFSTKEHIKGDMEIDARGTSVLLVREIQSQNLMMMVTNFTANPLLSELLKVPALLRRLVQAHMLPADEIVFTDDELKQLAATKETPPDPEVMKRENEMNLANMDRETKLMLADFERETALIALAAKHNITLDQLQTRIAEGREARDSKERQFAAEVAVTDRRDAAAAAQGEAQPPTAGGSI